ncbi:MAG: translocation/assembly module TamB domain-containing protein [Bacteroidota bacterium]
MIFRSQTMQTLMVRLAADYFSKELKTEIKIYGFDISLRNGLVIEGISALDLHRETLFSAKRLSVSPGYFSWKKRKLNISQVVIDQGKFQLLTHKGDSSLNLQLIIDHFASTDTTQPDTTSSKPWDLTVSSVILANMHFRMHDENAEPVLSGMDFTNLDVSGINLELSDISFDEISIHATINHLSAKERCGIVLRNLSGSFQVGARFLKAHNLKILTDHSDLSLSFDFLYNEWSAYNDFLNAVIIRAKIDSSYLDIQDIGYFAPDLAVMKDRIAISGDIRGSVSNFKARNLKLAFGKSTMFWGNLNALGLPDLEETFVDLNIKKLTANCSDLEAFLLPGDTRRLTLPEFLMNAGVVNLTGKFTGFYNDFVANAKLNSALGKISADLSLIRQKGSKTLGYKGRLDVQSLELGKLTDNQNLLGRITCQVDLNGNGFSLNDADLKMNLRIDSVYLNQYNYSGLSLSGVLSEKKFNGNFNVDDPNIRFDFNGLIDMTDSLPYFDFSAKVHHASLFKLNLLKRDTLTNLSTSVKVNIKGNDLDNLDGFVKVKNTTYSEGKKVITMDEISLLTRQDTASGKSYHLQSDFVDADITGNFSFSALIPSLSTFIQNYLASFSLNDSLVAQQGFQNNQEMNYSIRFKKSDEVTSVFLPFLRISPNSVIHGNYDDSKDALVIKGESSSVFINNIELENWYLEAETKRDNLSVTSGASRVYIVKASKTDSFEIRLDSLLLISDIRHDSIIYNINWSGKSKPSVVGGFVSFYNNPAIELKFNDFDVSLDDKYWNIDPANRVIIDSSMINISKLIFHSGDQYLKINGAISEQDSDTLNLDLNKIDVSKVDRLLGQNAVDIDGILQGNVKLTGIYRNLSVFSDLRINKFKFNKELLGDATFKVNFDNEASRFNILSNIIYTGNVGVNIPFSLQGSLILNKKNPTFDFDLSLKNLNLKIFGPFVKDFMSGVTGQASGNVKIQGNSAKPVITGQLQLMRTEFKINYLNVPYSFADVVTIDTNAFIFNNITLFDSLGHKSVLNGRITHKNFNNLALDLHIDMDDFSAFSSTRAQNSIFFGKARASGTASITGPVNNILISVKATNGGKTQITIPIDLTRSVGQADYIIFVEPVVDSIVKPVVKPVINTMGLGLDLALRVNEDAEVEVYFPGQLGNLTASGNGNLLMTMTPTTPFTLSGNYKLSKGFFLFQLKNYVRLPMSLIEGSSISWVGDPTDANISISAVYKTKAPLKGITTEPSLEGTRIPVDCIIRLKGKLMNPEISFGIKLPNVEENIKNQVFAAIDTNNAVVMADQIIYLLAVSQFKPVVGVSSNVDMSGTAISLVTNQLNSMISQISSNVSVNMNYQPGSATTSQEFDVGISTQLFNNRLLIDGTFGMNTTSATTEQKTSTIVGDINIEYILTKNRRWRARAFNRTNTTSVLYNNSPYTQGIGIKYQRDFSNFGELFKSQKSK